MFHACIKYKGSQLVITFQNDLSRQDAEQLYSYVHKNIAKLKKGFHVIGDMSGLERMDRGARLFIEQLMDLLNNHGVSKVVRILSDKNEDFGFNIMSLFHYSKGVTIHTFRSYQEAKKHLSDKIRIKIPESASPKK